MSNDSDNEPMQQYHYFLTVDRCRQGKRGIFSNRGGIGYFKEGAPHTEDEIWKILGAFDLILDPKSLPFTEEELAKYTRWFPLAEYSDEYGYVLRKEQLENPPTLADCP